MLNVNSKQLSKHSQKQFYMFLARLQREGLLPIDCQILVSFNISEENLKKYPTW